MLAGSSRSSAAGEVRYVLRRRLDSHKSNVKLEVARFGMKRSDVPTSRGDGWYRLDMEDVELMRVSTSMADAGEFQLLEIMGEGRNTSVLFWFRAMPGGGIRSESEVETNISGAKRAAYLASRRGRHGDGKGTQTLDEADDLALPGKEEVLIMLSFRFVESSREVSSGEGKDGADEANVAGVRADFKGIIRPLGETGTSGDVSMASSAQFSWWIMSFMATLVCLEDNEKLKRMGLGGCETKVFSFWKLWFAGGAEWFSEKTCLETIGFFRFTTARKLLRKPSFLSDR